LAKHGVCRPKSRLEPVLDPAKNSMPGALNIRLTLHISKAHMWLIVPPFNSLLFSSERPISQSINRKTCHWHDSQKHFFYKRSPSELRLSAVEGRSCLSSCRRFLPLSFLILAQSDLGIKTIVPQKKTLNPVGQWIYDPQNRIKEEYPWSHKKKVGLCGRMDLNGLKHKIFGFELRSVANIEDGVRETSGPSVV
jgi:hypothetical protein